MTRYRTPCLVAWLTFALALSSGLSLAAAQGPSASEAIRPKAVLHSSTSGLIDKPPVVSALAVSPDGRLLVTAGDDHLVRVWELAGTRLIHELPGHKDWIRSVAVSPDGRLLASGGDDRRIRLWDMETGQWIRTFPVHAGAIYSICFDPTGSKLAVVGFESVLRIYDIEGDEPPRTVDCNGHDLRAVAYTPDGRILAVAGRDGKIRLIDPSSGAIVKTISAHHRRIRALVFSADGAMLVSAGEGLHIRVWDMAGNEKLAAPARPGRVLSLAFCGPNHVAAGGSDNVIRILDVTTGREAYRLVGHSGSVASLVYHDGNGLLFSGSFDTTARLWSVPPSVVEETALRPDAPELGQ